jgi:hypothetical protein
MPGILKLPPWPHLMFADAWSMLRPRSWCSVDLQLKGAMCQQHLQGLQLGPLIFMPKAAWILEPRHNRFSIVRLTIRGSLRSVAETLG